MPYYSGKRMTYHYFVDFHTAILEKVYCFLPELLPVLNAIFILIFALSVYSLARENGRRAATIATVVATFGWGFSYVSLFSSLTSGQSNVSHNYMYQYDGLFGLPPIFDNLLQQRPLLNGLPAFALVLALLKNMEDENRILLVGVITGLLFPFHSISFFCCYVAYFVSVLLNIKRFRISYLYFLVPSVATLPFVLSAEAAASISFGDAWAYTFIKENPIYYYVLKLGIPFLISLISLVELGHKLLNGAFVILFLIPNFILLTPNTWDMYKFLIFSWVPIAVLTGIALARTIKSIALVLILLSILASASVVIYDLGTNYPAASWDEYNLGVWVRENTPQKSVFLTYYSIHSPPIMVGGRERVLSYLTGPTVMDSPLTTFGSAPMTLTVRSTVAKTT